MKQIWNLITSMKLTAVLLTIFAFAIGYATIIESDYSTQTAQAEVYSALWFEVLLVSLSINLLSSMIHHSMFKVKKWNIVLFHSSFLVILIAAGITRFMGYEGNMRIREGETENRITSRETYISAIFDKNGDKSQFKKMVLLSEISENHFNEDVHVSGDIVNITLKEYIPNVSYEFVEDKEKGKTFVDIMMTLGDGTKQLKLSEGESVEADDFILDFGANVTSTKPIIKISFVDGNLRMSNPVDFTTLVMETRTEGTVEAGENELNTRVLYRSANTNFVIRKLHPYAYEQLVSTKVKGSRNRLDDALKVEVTYKGKSKEVTLIGSSGAIGEAKTVDFDGMKVDVAYGATIKTLPFSLKLIDFELERYPGSMSPASYASEVILIDKEENIEMPYRIYMNHILEHRSFRFFQSSFDKDEKGTVLSVNNDPGTIPTYIGYLMLGIGMFSSFFTSNGRFRKLMKKGRALAEQRDSLASLFLALALFVGADTLKAEDVNPIVKDITSFDKEHASHFARLITQDSTGRMKPLNTLNEEIVNKVHGGTVAGLTSDQMILGMMMRPESWREINLIKTKNKEINKILGIDENSKYASFSQFLEDPKEIKGYKIQQYVEEAARKAPAQQNQFDKDIIKVDERFNIVYMTFSGEFYKIFPKPGDAGNKWFATVEAVETFDPNVAGQIQSEFREYIVSIENALSWDKNTSVVIDQLSGKMHIVPISKEYAQMSDKDKQLHSWKIADEALKKIEQFQKLHGAAVYPSENKINAELFYNKYNVFEKLMPYYLGMGFILLILSFVKILKPGFRLGFFSKTATAFLIIFFVLHTIGLITRWYVAGHAPWSDGYESMIYIAWATVLAGFIFSRNSVITLAATGILAGLILFVAHLNWMDPQVTNLAPVLKSYWLSIHVSMITASYGFLALGALLGFIALLLFAMRTKASERHINLSILELNTINEMSLMVGLALLTVGNFLGGVWANESWGRYWGWDPKETWALVSILLYAVVVHLRFIKAIYTPFVFAMVSLLTFTSVIMTYFGVNYYLAGMHSYAKGDPVPIPDFVPWTYAIIFVLILVAARNRKIEN